MNNIEHKTWADVTYAYRYILLIAFIFVTTYLFIAWFFVDNDTDIEAQTIHPIEEVIEKTEKIVEVIEELEEVIGDLGGIHQPSASGPLEVNNNSSLNSLNP